MDLLQRIRRVPPIWLAAGVGAVVLLLARKARAATDVVNLIDADLTETQRANATIIAQAFDDAGLPDTATAAAIVNAYAESGLDHTAEGDSGHSIGLFQLSDWGAGHGMTVQERKDPYVNVATILQREVLAGMGKTFRRKASEGARVAELAAIFSRDIERPKDREGQAAKRSALAFKLFPTLA